MLERIRRRILRMLGVDSLVVEPSMIERLDQSHRDHICSLREQLVQSNALAKRMILGPETTIMSDAAAKMVPTGRPHWREVRQKLTAINRAPRPTPQEIKERADYWEKKAAEKEVEVGIVPDLSKELTREAAENAECDLRTS